MNDPDSLNHIKWECKCHVVWGVRQIFACRWTARTFMSALQYCAG